MPDNNVEVVVVGGGAAGVAAAKRLCQASVRCLLVEGRPRLGGRAYTVTDASGFTLDLGCGWLHSGDRNSWTRIAEEAGRVVDRRPPKWGVQYRHLGFSPDEQKAARGAFAAWMERLAVKPPPSDCAADALAPGGEWNGYLEAISGFISGARLERISATDYLAYDEASTDINLRAADGYGDLIASSLPTRTILRLAAPVAKAAVLLVTGDEP